MLDTQRGACHPTVMDLPAELQKPEAFLLARKVGEEDAAFEARAAATISWLGASYRLEDFCSHIAEGGDPLEYAKGGGVLWSDLKRWLRTVSGRWQAYQEALDERREFVVRRILNDLEALGLQKADGTNLTVQEKLAALKLLGTHLKLFSDQLEVTGKMSLEAIVLAAHAKVAERKKAAASAAPAPDGGGE